LDIDHTGQSNRPGLGCHIQRCSDGPNAFVRGDLQLRPVREVKMSRSNLRRSALVALAPAAIAVVLLRPSPGKTDAPAGRYTIPGDGTVFDTATTLTWQRAANMTGMIWA